MRLAGLAHRHCPGSATSLVSAEPSLDGVHGARLLLTAGFWQVQQACKSRISRNNCFSRSGGYPKNVGVLIQVQVSVFHSGLGLAHTAQAAECRPATICKRLFEFHQDPFPTGEERIAFRKIRKRLNSNKGTKCDIESRATRMLAGGATLRSPVLSALAPSLTASFALRPGRSL
jgi:hypothetical protein